jgi:lysozyme
MHHVPAAVRSFVVAGATLGILAAVAASPASAGSSVAPIQPAQQAVGMMPADSPDAVPVTGTSGARTAYPAVTTYLQGTDVSSYQHPGGAPIDWAAVAASGQSFTVIKATESTTYTDPYLVTDVSGARAAGLVVGVYHYAHPEISPTLQADAFSRQVNGLAGTLLPPVLDLEHTGGLTSPALISWTSAFLLRVRQDTGRVPMIYTGPYFWSTAMAGSTAFGQYRLWEAHYTTAAAPEAISGWPTWNVWQYSNGTFGAPAPVPGIPARVDRDRFGGTKAQLLALASSSRPGVAAPFTGTATAAQFPDATYVQVTGDAHVYEIAGLAPMWVMSWSHVGGPHPVRVVSLASFHTLRSSPLEGTFLIDRLANRAYRVTGGAPVVVTDWVPFGGLPHYVVVDDWDIVHAGDCSGYCHLATTVRDGTILRMLETGQVYVVAGGAPVYVSTWATYGGVQPYVNLNQAVVTNAGAGGVWDHLSFTPADSTVISDSLTGQFYLLTAGTPTLADPTTLGSTPFTLIDHLAIANAGGTGYWAHLR